MAYVNLSVDRQREVLEANLGNEESLLLQANVDVTKLKARLAVESDANKALAQADLEAAEARVTVAEAVVEAVKKEIKNLPKE